VELRPDALGIMTGRGRIDGRAFKKQQGGAGVSCYTRTAIEPFSRADEALAAIVRPMHRDTATM